MEESGDLKKDNLQGKNILVLLMGFVIREVTLLKIVYEEAFQFLLCLMNHTKIIHFII